MAGKGTNFKLKYGKIPTKSRIGRAPLKAFNGPVKTRIASVNKSNIAAVVNTNNVDHCTTNTQADSNSNTVTNKEIKAKVSRNDIADISIQNSESKGRNSSENSCVRMINIYSTTSTVCMHLI